MEEFVMTQEAFDRLWARVQGAAAPERARDEAAVLRRFLEETGEALAFETTLLRRSGCARAALTALCRETRGRLSRLRAAYFLMTGNRCRAPETCPVCGSFLTDLRKAWLGARDRAAAYGRAAQDGCPEELRALYRELAAEETAHAEALRRLILSFFR